jgi:hypothetical protein
MSIHRNCRYVFVLGVLSLLTTGCSKTDTTDLNYKTAINNHYKAFPTCFWSEPKNPVQAATSDNPKIEAYVSAKGIQLGSAAIQGRAVRALSYRDS